MSYRDLILPTPDQLRELTKITEEITNCEGYIQANSRGFKEVFIGGDESLFAVPIGEDRHIRLIFDDGKKERILIGMPWREKLSVWKRARKQMPYYTVDSP